MLARWQQRCCVVLLLSLTPIIIADMQQHPSSSSGGKQKPQNIVLFMADDLGMGDVGCFGNTSLRTPSLDRLAREGAMLTHSLAAASVCTPSRAAFLTGRYPARMGMVPTNIVRVNMFLSSVSGLPASEVTLGELAQSQGYKTALIGKWHLGIHCSNSQDFCHHPMKQGFDYYYGLPLTNLKDFGEEKESVVTARIAGVDNKVATVAVAGIITVLFLFKAEMLGRWYALLLILLLAVPSLTFLLIARNLHLLNGVIMRGYQVVEQPIELRGFAKRLVAEGESFLQQRGQDGQPFLLVMPWLQVHTAMHASSEFRGKSKHGPYGDNVEELDWSVGRILATLDDLGLASDTFVYFTSDNGGHVEERGPHGNREGGHNGVYRGGKAMGGMDGGIRVPTLVRWPGRVQGGSVVSTPVSLMDVFPTVASILGAALPADRTIDGLSLLPLLAPQQQQQQQQHRFLFHYCGTDIHAARYAPNDGTGSVWKVHYATPNWLPGTEECAFICDCYGSAVTWHDPPLLYNIGHDPSEHRLLDPAQHTQIMSLIEDAVAQHRSSLASAAPAPENQYSVVNLLPRPWLQPCCPGQFPRCRCKDEAMEHIGR